MSRSLAIFDVDGTLTRTYAVDQDCFVQTFRQEFGFQNVHADWDRYHHTTDSGITLELFRRQLGRDPSEDEKARMQATFLRLLDAAMLANPNGSTETPGAANLLQRLRAHDRWSVAIATGCWRASAERKLQAAGLDAAQIPMACCDEILERNKIIHAAVAMAGERFDKIVYVGDGVWDIRSARETGIGFVGIGTGERARALRDAGAESIFEDFADTDALLAALEQAARPNST